MLSWCFQEHVSHPFAVAVFKDSVYWDDWKLNAVFSADKDHGVGIVRLQSELQGVMDLKVHKNLKLKVLHVHQILNMIKQLGGRRGNLEGGELKEHLLEILCVCV